MVEASCRYSNRRIPPVGIRSSFRTRFTKSRCTIRFVECERSSYKYLRNLFSELEFPHASDLLGSKTWQSVRQMGETGMVGRRKASKYLHRAPEELYDLQADPDELTNLARPA